MAYNGSGTFSIINTFVYDTVISETDVNTNFSDIATGLSTAITKDGQTTITANIPMAGFKFTGLGAGNASGDSATLGQVQAQAYVWGGTAGGTADALTVTPSPAITAYAAGQSFRFIAASNNTGAATVAISGLTTKAIQNNGSALSADDIVSGKLYEIVYDGTQFQLNQVKVTAAGISTSLARGSALAGNSSGVAAAVDISAADNALVGDGTDAVATGVVTQGVHTIWVPAGAMTSRTTSGAASGSSETSTNKVMLSTLDFDPASDEFAQFFIRMPKSWDEGTVTAIFVWSHASTTTNFGVVWGLQAVAISDGDAGDAAFGTAQTVTDTGGTTDDIYQTSATSAITIGGTPAEGDWVAFQAYRDADNGSDTMAIDARLHGVLINYTLNAGNDA